MTLELDVTRPEQAKSAVAETTAYFGRFDVVVNNAGYPFIGAVEEASAEDVRAMYNTNIFGTLSVVQAALPFCVHKAAGTFLESQVPSVTSRCRWAAITALRSGPLRPFTRVWRCK